MLFGICERVHTRTFSNVVLQLRWIHKCSVTLFCMCEKVCTRTFGTSWTLFVREVMRETFFGLFSTGSCRKRNCRQPQWELADLWIRLCSLFPASGCSLICRHPSRPPVPVCSCVTHFPPLNHCDMTPCALHPREAVFRACFWVFQIENTDVEALLCDCGYNYLPYLPSFHFGKIGEINHQEKLEFGGICVIIPQTSLLTSIVTEISARKSLSRMIFSLSFYQHCVTGTNNLGMLLWAEKPKIP